MGYIGTHIKTVIVSEPVLAPKIIPIPVPVKEERKIPVKLAE